MTSLTRGPYSPAVRAGDYIFVSGQVGFRDSETGEIINGIEEQTKQCLERMKQVLETEGTSLDNVVKVTLFVRNIDDFGKVNEIYKDYFPKQKPARSAIVANLVNHEILIEADCIAYYPCA